MNNKNTFELDICGKKMTFNTSDFPNITRMISHDDIPSAPLMDCKQIKQLYKKMKKMFHNEGGKFDFKNGSAKTFFLNDLI